MKLHRECLDCHEFTHISKNYCKKCGKIFTPKVKLEPSNNARANPPYIFPSAKDAIGSPATPVLQGESYSGGAGRSYEEFSEAKELTRKLVELRTAYNKLESVVDKLKDEVQGVRKNWADFYRFQAELIYQRAFQRYSGRSAEIYLESSEKDLFNAEGVFRVPALPDRSAEFPEGEPPDEVKKDAIAIIIKDREPHPGDLEKIPSYLRGLRQ